MFDFLQSRTTCGRAQVDAQKCLSDCRRTVVSSFKVARLTDAVRTFVSRYQLLVALFGLRNSTA